MSEAKLMPTADDLRSNATFEALMWALARTGIVQALPYPDFLALAESLLDRECSFFCPDATLATAIARTGADAVSLPQAEYVFMPLGDARSISMLDALLCGNLLYPDASATIFSSAVIGSGTRLRLSGPGVNGSLDIAIGGVDPAFWALRAAAIRYPLGWDVFLMDGDRLVGLPRSTIVEVL
ncbi:phosphonate C-P lyase system protein PhnH [Rhizobium sp. BK251]|uniref:phosphonate C-P lyase system protein PhnH n=1 Tax=Rhizobium sp. BK251 TaxID=2512125 RepID=UPI001043275B|nr:phosphonate C-P lyase system protein PhnH [Rhizobium sp. BK251]TCL67242.1 alpha-D-ribose 1-methylphosphonate 5-triphosphate synthase subunit PhnH [Rhizobium sp. BK251]